MFDWEMRRVGPLRLRVWANPVGDPSKPLGARRRRSTVPLAMAPADTAGLERLVRTVRSDAEQRKRLVCNACFLAALAQLHPEVVAKPMGERRWRREELDSLAAATAGRIDDAEPVHVIVGVDDLNVNIRYMKGSLVYLRAETNPPLRCMMYSSMPPPPGQEESSADDSADEPKIPGQDETADLPTGPAKVLDDADASHALVRAVLERLNDDPTIDTAGGVDADDPEAVATWRAARVRESLTATHGAHWHVVHDAKPFGAAVITSGEGRRVLARRGRYSFLVWRHSSSIKSPLDAIRRRIRADLPALRRGARTSFLVVCAVYALWYRAMCGEEEEGGIKGGTRPNDDVRMNDDDRGGIIAGAEPRLRTFLCAAGKSAAPFAFIALAVMFAFGGGGTASAIGARYARAFARRKRKAA